MEILFRARTGSRSPSSAHARRLSTPGALQRGFQSVQSSTRGSVSGLGGWGVGYPGFWVLGFGFDVGHQAYARPNLDISLVLIFDFDCSFSVTLCTLMIEGASPDPRPQSPERETKLPKPEILIFAGGWPWSGGSLWRGRGSDMLPIMRSVSHSCRGVLRP